MKLDFYKTGPQEILPFAQFRFNAEVITLNEHQFRQAIADGKLCGCGECLACRAVEYATESGWFK